MILATGTTLILITYFAMLFSSFQTQASIMNAYPEGIEKREFLSCENQCGTHTSVCSCQSICLIYDNCCEDFRDTCPEQLDSTEEIKHLFGSTVICKESFFMVSSCPEQITMPTVASTSSSTSMIPWTVSGATWVAEHHRDLIGNMLPIWDMKLWSIPVTDIFNNVTFKNFYYYSCNEVAESKPLRWNLIVPMRDGASFESIPEFVFMKAKLKKTMYTSPVSLAETAKENFCVQGAISKCAPLNIIPSQEARSQENVKKCTSFLSYVKVDIKHENQTRIRITYRNIYCLRCLKNDTHEDVEILSSMDVPSFKDDQIIMYALIFYNGVKLVFESMVNGHGQLVTWQRATCPYTVSKDTNTKCKDLICRPGAINLDSTCAFKSRLHVIVYDYGMTYSPEELNQLSSLFSCLLEEDTQRRMIDSDQTNLMSSFQGVGIGSGRNSYYGFEIRIGNFPADFSSQIYNVTERISKVIQRFRQLHTIDGDNLKSVQPNNNNNNLQTNMFCLCWNTKRFSHNCRLACRQGHWFEESEVTEVDAYILESSCFDLNRATPSTASKLNNIDIFLILTILFVTS